MSEKRETFDMSVEHDAFGCRCRHCGHPVGPGDRSVWKKNEPSTVAHWRCFALYEEKVESSPSITKGGKQ